MKAIKAQALIAELQRKLKESEAQQVYRHHFAHGAIDRTSIDRLMGSGVILSMTFLGGKEVFEPVMIRNGLSKETIEAIKADLVRSFEYATELKP